MTICQHCGKPVEKGHSSADHRRLFGLIGAAFHQWPESHEFQPDDAEHLRAWLLCKAGYRTVTTIPVEYAEDQPAMLKLVMLTVEAAIKAAKGHAFVRPHGSAIAVFHPKSLSNAAADRQTFGRVREAVEEVIAAETGLSAEQLLKEMETAA